MEDTQDCPQGRHLPVRAGRSPEGYFRSRHRVPGLYLENRILIKILSIKVCKTRYDKTSEEYIGRCTKKKKDLEGTVKATGLRQGTSRQVLSSATLGVKGKTVRKGQAEKSTGWMPWH